MDREYNLETPCHTAVMWKKLSEDEIVISTPNFQQIRLATIGKAIFERSNGKNTVSEIIDYLRNKYPQMSENQIKSETYKFLNYMQSIGVIIIDWEIF